MIFRMCGKDYRGSSALEIVNAIRRETFLESEGTTARHFMLNSLAELGRFIPLKRLGSCKGLDDETFALGYLFLRDQYGLGELSDVPDRNLWARPLYLT